MIRKNLSWLISPLDKKEFRQNYYEKKPLIIHRKQTDYYNDLLTLTDLENIVEKTAQNNKLNITLNHATKKINSNEYLKLTSIQNVSIRTEIDLPKVLQLFNEEKATIIVHDINSVWKPLQNLAKHINTELICNSGTNIFITPNQAQCFEAHYDENDLFIIQIHGKKHWKIYENPILLPIEPQNKKKVDFSRLKLLFEVDIEAGDIIYMPRGFVHEVTTADADSIHITLGIVNLTWQKLLIDYLVNLAFNTPAFRDSYISEQINQHQKDGNGLLELKKILLEELDMKKLISFSRRYIKKGKAEQKKSYAFSLQKGNMAYKSS